MDGLIALAYAKKLYDLAEGPQGPQGEPGSGAVGTVAEAYSTSKTYAVGDYVIHDEELYRCTTAITTAEAFNSAHWTKLVLADEVSDLKSDLSKLNDEIGETDFIGVTGYVTKPCTLEAGKTYYVKKLSGALRLFTRETADGENLEGIIPTVSYASEKWFSEFTPQTTTNYLRILAEGNGASFVIYDKDALAWKGEMADYEDYSNSGIGTTSLIYPIEAGATYKISCTGVVKSLFTKNVDSSDATDNIETVWEDNPFNSKEVVFTASSDANFLRIVALLSSTNWTLKVDRLSESNIPPKILQQFNSSELLANTYYDLPSVGETTNITPQASGVGNATLAVTMEKGDTITLHAQTMDTTRAFGFVNESKILKTKIDDCTIGISFTCAENGTALITTLPSLFGDAVLYRNDIGTVIQNGLISDIYAPYPQLSANGEENSDFDSETATTADIYNYIDAIAVKYPQLIDKTVMGKDATNTYNVNRYVIADKQLNSYVATIFIGANEHGPTSDPRECAIVVCRFIKDICEANAKTNKFLNIIKKYCRVVVIPVSNPYGFDNNTRNNGNNVNINRNYDTPGWSAQADADKGASAGSEVETQYIMNTVTAFKPQVALDLHCLGYVNSANDKKCHWQGHIYNDYKINEIARSMKRDYDLSCTAYGIGNYNLEATGDAYFNYKGIKGLLLEFNARDGVSGSSDNLHTANIMEANYTFMLRIINMLMSDFDESLDISLFR